MAPKNQKPGETAVIEAASLDGLISWLTARGFDVHGPTHRDGVVRFGAIRSADDLPIGLADVQERGSYHTLPRGDDSVFGLNNGPNSLKDLLFPPERLLQRMERHGRGFTAHAVEDTARPLAVIGCRACDLAALARLDRVLLCGSYRDGDYATRRNGLFTVAVNCCTVAPTCFCASVGAGPRPAATFDLCLTEFAGPAGRQFVVEAATAAGAKALAAIPHSPATPEQAALPEAAAAHAAAAMQRSVAPAAADHLKAVRDLALWEDVGGRCLTCGNCTSVCPTCFCHTVEDTTDLAGQRAERRRRWDSCFTLGFTFVNAGSVRYSAAARYRQWLTHKFATWADQFGMTGCVGCGRCIAWCPVGIDVTAELRRLEGAVRAMKEEDRGNPQEPPVGEPAVSRP